MSKESNKRRVETRQQQLATEAQQKKERTYKENTPILNVNSQHANSDIGSLSLAEIEDILL